MITINKLDEKSIFIQDKKMYKEGAIFAALFSAHSISGGLVVLLSKKLGVKVAEKYENFNIDGDIPSSAEDCVKKLNAFVGNFKTVGGSSSTIWGAITGDIDNQTDLINKFDDIDTYYLTNLILTRVIGGVTEVMLNMNISPKPKRVYLNKTKVTDANGTTAIATAINSNLIEFSTVSTSPNGADEPTLLTPASDTFAALPATVTAATALYGRTPAVTDYTRVRADEAATPTGSTTERYITSIVGDNLTWGDYIVMNTSDYQEQSGSGDSGKLLTGGATAGTFGASVDPATFETTAGAAAKISAHNYAFDAHPLIQLAMANKVSVIGNIPTFYLDAFNGDDSNDGYTALSPKKTLASLVLRLQSNKYTSSSNVIINLAAGTYIISESYMGRTIGANITFKGVTNNPTAVELRFGVQVYNVPNLNFTDVVIAIQGSGTDVRFNTSRVTFTRCVIKSQIRTAFSIVTLSESVTLDYDLVNGTYGNFYMSAKSYLQFSSVGVKIIVSESILTKVLFTCYNDAGISFNYLNNGNVLMLDGTLGDTSLFTGEAIHLGHGTLWRVGNLRAVFPNGTFYRAAPSSTDINTGSEVTLPIAQEHNISTKRDVADCHPISAITGLREALPKTGKRINTNIGVVGEGISASIKISDITDSYPELAGMDLVRVNVQRASTTVFNVYLATDFTSDINVSFCYINRYTTTYVSGNGYFLISPQSSVTALSITHGSIGNRLQYSTVIKFSDNITGKNYYIRFDGEISMTTEGLVNGTPPTLGTSTWKWEIFEV